MHKLRNLGLCQKAKFVISGEKFVLEAIRKKEVYLVFLATDSGVNTKKRITDKASFYNVSVNQEFSCEELSNAIGKVNRHVIGITDRNFAKILEK